MVDFAHFANSYAAFWFVYLILVGFFFCLRMTYAITIKRVHFGVEPHHIQINNVC